LRAGLPTDASQPRYDGCTKARPRRWTVAQLALSCSVFFERFNRTLGVAAMEYLLAWRMAEPAAAEGSVAEVAERVGYSCQSTFSVAFTRYVGLPPTR
jgi:AraC-like DNA-binding protein